MSAVTTRREAEALRRLLAAGRITAEDASAWAEARQPD